MTKEVSQSKNLKGVFSFQPLVEVLKKMIAEKQPGAQKLYKGLVAEVEAKPELLQSVENNNWQQDPELVETLVSTIFPPSVISGQNIYAITVPFSHEIVYASPKFEQQFLKNDTGNIVFGGLNTKKELATVATDLAYQLILKTFYSHQVSDTAVSVHALKDANGLTRYFEVTLNARFVKVMLADKNFQLPADFTPQQAGNADELAEAFPLHDFRFEGFSVIEIYDVTQRQVISEIRTALLKNNSFSDATIYDELQQHLQSLAGIKNIQIGITSFFKTNGFNLNTQTGFANSLLFKSAEARKKADEVCSLFHDEFSQSLQPLHYEVLTGDAVTSHPLLKYYIDLGAKSILLCPLKKDNGVLIGLLELYSGNEGELQFYHLSRIQPAIPLFDLALEKMEESIEIQIDKTIKEHFTAIQPGVEWKFTEAAFHYLQKRQENEAAKMPGITFNEVYPLYAAIDIRNSSTQRSQSIQLDLLEQLEIAKSIIAKAKKAFDFPLLKETEYRIEKFIDSISDNLLSDEELMVTHFLQNDLHHMFQNLKHSNPELKQAIEKYFATIDVQRNLVYHHRKDYEESITRINDVLDRFVDNQQKEAQQAFPHYFERYVTDGIELNMYVGQSLAPHLPFNEMQVRNLKLWQLTLLTKAAKITAMMEKRLAVPLQTTQLILAHSMPLSISFRPKERKFDVDGAYNIRYEIVKKRIDKVHLKNSDERLTQPGTVAIVYSQQKELQEYLEFIAYLQNEKLLGQNVEQLELEDTQGISGLKAIRVNIVLEDEQEAEASRKPVKSEAVSIKQALA